MFRRVAEQQFLQPAPSGLECAERVLSRLPQFVMREPIKPKTREINLPSRLRRAPRREPADPPITTHQHLQLPINLHDLEKPPIPQPLQYFPTRLRRAFNASP